MAPRGLSGRILGAFLIVSIAAWFAIGATMFVLLRGMHADATTSALADVTQTIAVRLRGAVLPRELRTIVTEVRDAVADSDITVHVIARGGGFVDIGAGGPDPVASIEIPAGSRRGDVVSGSVAYTDGLPHLYAATVLSEAAADAPRAVLLSTVDRSGATALRDVLRTLPILILVTLLVGIPLALALSRSVVRPLHRLRDATAELAAAPGRPFEPLPLSGPAEVRDLTDRFNGMSAELVAARRRESELLANLRHDLRTPLTVISGYATALADGTATGDDAGRAARAIEDESARLERLVAELGAIERLQAGDDGLRPGPIDAAEAVRTAVERFAPAADGAGVDLAADGPAPAGSPGPTLTADRSALERILANLIGNALAAVPRGGHVVVAAREVDDGRVGGPAVAFSVTDDGPGFPPGGVERAFERFYRGDPARSGQGSGLGLAIVLELARAHGGVAQAENLSPRGARVSVVLPLVPTIA
jgi:signal transduction histidine kinase